MLTLSRGKLHRTDCWCCRRWWGVLLRRVRRETQLHSRGTLKPQCNTAEMYRLSLTSRCTGASMQSTRFWQGHIFEVGLRIGGFIRNLVLCRSSPNGPYWLPFGLWLWDLGAPNLGLIYITWGPCPCNFKPMHHSSQDLAPFPPAMHFQGGAGPLGWYSPHRGQACCVGGCVW